MIAPKALAYSCLGLFLVAFPAVAQPPEPAPTPARTAPAALARTLAAPRVSLDDLFGEVVVAATYGDWQVLGAEGIRDWPLFPAALERLAAMAQAGAYLPVETVTARPVVLSEANREHFQGLPEGTRLDGKLIGYKYVFYPQALLPSEELGGHGQALAFYLVRPLPAHLRARDLAQPLCPELEGLQLQMYQDIHARYSDHPHEETQVRFAADRGHAQAQVDLARQLGPKGGLEALRYLRAAADKGHPWAMKVAKQLSVARAPQN